MSSYNVHSTPAETHELLLTRAAVTVLSTGNNPGRESAETPIFYNPKIMDQGTEKIQRVYHEACEGQLVACRDILLDHDYLVHNISNS